MEGLTEQEWADIGKMSSDRIRARLTKEGFEKEAVMAVTKREELMEMLAECVKERKGLEKLRLDEIELKRREIEKADTDRKLQREELELKKLQLEQDKTVREAEIAWRQEEIERVRQKDEEEARRLNSADIKLKRYGDALRGCIAKMPNDSVEILPWFRSVEKVFADLKVEREFQVHLLKPHLTSQAAAFVTRLDTAVASDFKLVKQAILHEFKLSSVELLHRFTSSLKGKDETYALYSSRLKSLLLYYLESRKCNDFQTLIELLICDRMKQALPESVLRYILSLENNRDGCWMPLKELASSLDIFMDTHINERPRQVVGAMGVWNGAKGAARGPPARPPPPNIGNGKAGNGNERREARSPSNNGGKPKHCFVCNATTHLANFHSKNVDSGAQYNRARPALMAVVAHDSGKESGMQHSADGIKHGPVVTSSASDSVGAAAADETEIKASICDVMIEESELQTDSPSHEKGYGDNVKWAVPCINEKHEDQAMSMPVLAPLRYVDVRVSDGQNVSPVISALYDTGAELPLAHPRIFQGLCISKNGSVVIRSAIGGSVKCDLCRMQVQRVDIDTDKIYKVSILCAVTDQANESLILTAEVIDQLMGVSCQVVQTVDEFDNGSDAEENSKTNDVISLPSGEFGIDKTLKSEGLAENLQAEQEADQSLNGCRSLCAKGKGGFYLKDGVLYRRCKIIGRPVDQLVVPVNRRDEVLRLAHDTYGAHQSPVNTAHRIKYSMWFPSLMQACKAYCKSCAVCCRRARVTCYDRVPIKPIAREKINFNHWMCDVTGPFWSNQNKAYNYCFVACDNKTRWPVAFALRSVNAQVICDCLLKLFSIFGVSQFVSFDNAAYNTAKLTQTFMKMLGVSPIFITPHHSEGNSIAERTIGKLKESIHKVAIEKPASWHKYLDLILWCWREVPHATLGASPYQLAFGHLPRGPCAILRDYWTGESDLPSDLGKSAADYLIELRERLAVANEFASSHLARAQQQYISRYNLRARDKHFEIGDTVLLLNPDTTSSRLWSRWRAPAKVVKRGSDYSYLIEIDGAQQWVHANKIRRFDVRVDEVICEPDIGNDNFAVIHSCSIIMDNDDDFGEIGIVNLPSVIDEPSIPLPSQKIDLRKLEHLTDQQRFEFLSVLDKYPAVFSETPGLCKGFEHEIKLTSEFVPKRIKPYKIPEKLKPQVDREIQELLRLGLIRESRSPMTSPLVCILKANGTDVRIVCDYRYVNRYTVPDPIGPPDMLQVIQQMGRSKYITTFDGKSSYWTIPLKPEDCWLTAFLCDSGEYEWTRAAFGLKNSGSSFVRMLNSVLQPIQRFAKSFVDDCAVHSEEWEEHLRNIDEFLHVIQECGLTLTLKKSEFAKPEVRFCGQIVGSGNRRIDPERMKAIHTLKPPETKKQVRQILGLFGWYREFIPNFSEIARPLTDLTAQGKSNHVRWTENEQQSFDMLKSSLLRAVENPLSIIDWKCPFNIFTDASEHTVAGVISQTDDRKNERPIAFYSRKLTSSQRGWSTIEKEAFAVLEALRRFETFIFGHEICLYSDHNPLTYITVSAPRNARLLRWSLALQNFNLKFHYKAGKTAAMAVPDCLTRLGPSDTIVGSSQEVG